MAPAFIIKKLSMRLLIWVLLFAAHTAVAQHSDEQLIRSMLARQVTEWNKGNVAGFMIGYWESDSLVFIGKNGPTYGYQQTLERYRKSYPDGAAMGKLTSTLISLKRLSQDYFFAVGKWQLERKAGNLSGSYTLLLRKTDGQWVIVCDHSS